MSYSAQNIRNICLLGHGGNGKTSLAESMLYLTGGTARLGKTTDGNTVCDYDPEETKRQISISMAVAPVEYNGCKINVLDTGLFRFLRRGHRGPAGGRRRRLVCSAKGGMSVGAEKAWKLCDKRKLPRIVYISKTDEENSDYNAAFATPARALRQEHRARGGPPSGTPTRRSSASSTCSISARSRPVPRASGWRSTSPPTSSLFWTSSTMP